MATVKQVTAALTAEAKKLNAAHRGTHVFDAPHPRDQAGPNWTCNFRAIGSKLPLDDMRDAIERVQARFPVIDW